MNRSQFVALVLSLSILMAFSFRMIEKNIDPTMVRVAGELLGLNFTESEIDSMIPDLEDHRKSALALREIEVDNSLYPGLFFRPDLEGFHVYHDRKKSKYPVFRDVMRPEKDMDLFFMTIPELASLIRSKQISCVELTGLFLDRLNMLDKDLHCVISLTESRAMEKARILDQELANGKYRGILHGIPYGAKDLLAAKGYKTTWGATPFKDQVLDNDATVIERLDDAGAILIAKLTLGALAWGDVWYGGTTRNPWDTLSGSSGSSAGSASAVAAGGVPFAIGSETLGSIVSPSTVCGATGLRPTFGRVSREGAMALSWTMDKLGPIARSALDCSLVLEAIAGPDSKDPYCLDRPYRHDDDIETGKLRIGYSKADFERNYRFKDQDSAILDVLRDMGYELIPVELPALPPLDVILAAEAATAFDQLTTENIDDQLVRQVRNAWPNYFRSARFIPAVEYIKANRVRTQLMEDMDHLFEKVDVIIHPSWASPALRITNHTGHPCVVIPNGFIDGKPTSISIMGKIFGEAQIVKLAQELQEKTPWKNQHPEWTIN